MAGKPDILIIGSGVAGLTSAVWLHDAGCRVHVFDAGTTGQESSWAGGGIISAVPPWAYPESINQLITRSRELYPELIDRLQQQTGIDCEYQHCGLVLSGWPESDVHNWLKAHNVLAQLGTRGHFVPALARTSEPAVYLPEVSQLRNPRLMRALSLWLRHKGVEITTNTPIEAIIHQQQRVTGIRLSNGRSIHARQIVIAAGAWTDRLLNRSSLNGFGIYPARGQMLLYQAEAGLIQHIVNTPEGYLIPRSHGRILAGSTVEHTGFDRRPSSAGFRKLAQMAKQLLPALKPDQIELHWAGLRPGIAGDEPLCGPYPGIDGLWIQSGGFRNGLGLAPANAESLKDQIVNSDTKTTETVNS